MKIIQKIYLNLQFTYTLQFDAASNYINLLTVVIRIFLKNGFFFCHFYMFRMKNIEFR